MIYVNHQIPLTLFLFTNMKVLGSLIRPRFKLVTNLYLTFFMCKILNIEF